MAKGKATAVNGVATIIITVPAVRKVSGGQAWFENHHPDDSVQVFITLPDGTVLNTYTDTQVAADNQGWYIGPSGKTEIRQMADFGTIPQAGLQLRVVGTKGDGSADTLRTNVLWGEPY